MNNIAFTTEDLSNNKPNNNAKKNTKFWNIKQF